jgi:hypothetical protein
MVETRTSKRSSDASEKTHTDLEKNTEAEEQMAEKQSKSKSKRQNDSQGTVESTELPQKERIQFKSVPKYASKLQLSSSSLDRFRSLEGLRRQALHSDPTFAKTKATNIQSSVYSTNFKTGHKRRKEQRNDAGESWFNMRSTPLSDGVTKDLQLIRNRNYLDPKRFYKSSDQTSQFVQIGTVVEGPTEYFSSRLSKKQRRTNLVDELLADGSSKYAQNKFKKMQQEKTAATMKRKTKAGKRR